MSQYPGGQWPNDPYSGQGSADPYAQRQQQPSDPYLGQGGNDPYAQPQDPYYAQPDPYYAQQQAYYAQQYYAQQQARPRQADEARRGQGGAGAAIVGLLLVLLGLWVLFRDEIDLDFAELWPIVVVVVGVTMVIVAFIPRRGS